MVQVLKDEIAELQNRKKELRGEFSEYELFEHLDIYIEIKSIDFTLKVLTKMLINKLEEINRN